MKKKFRTSDGYTLWAIRLASGSHVWHDNPDPLKADLEFGADTDGWPIEETGARLEGDYID